MKQVDTDWFYAQDNQQVGPVSLTALKDMLTVGSVRNTDLVWTEGMLQWLPASSIPVLVCAPSLSTETATASDPAESIPLAQPAGVLGYFTTNLGIPRRAIENLRKYALPRGDTTDWPLDDLHVNHFRQTMLIRRRITTAARLFRLTILFALLFDVVVVFAAIGLAINPRIRGSAFLAGMATGIIFVLAVTFIVYLAARATYRSHRWGAMVMFLLFLFGAIGYGFAFLRQLTNHAPTEVMIGPIFMVVLLAVFAVIAMRAFLAIPRYLLQPAWCQELVAAGKM